MKLAKFCLAMATMALACSPAHAAIDGKFLSTPRVAKIFQAVIGEDSQAFFDLKAQGSYCYLEENPRRAAYMLLDKIVTGSDSLDESALSLEPTPCFDAFLSEASKSQYSDEPIDARIYQTSVSFSEFRHSTIRYIASCMWEKDREYLQAEIADVKNVDQIWDYLKDGYQPGEYDQVGFDCMPGFLDFVETDKLFRYNLFQQILLRRNLD